MKDSFPTSFKTKSAHVSPQSFFILLPVHTKYQFLTLSTSAQKITITLVKPTAFFIRKFTIFLRFPCLVSFFPNAHIQGVKLLFRHIKFCSKSKLGILTQTKRLTLKGTSRDI